MEFKKIQLNGFKSFADKANFLIEEGLTGIVGPNGCGKSNIVESLRWVMGETSAKSMRGSGMEDVIFSGTSNKASKNIAEVSIEVENNNYEVSVLKDNIMTKEEAKDIGAPHYDEVLFFADPKINALLLERANESIESALKDLKLVTTFGQSDKYEDRQDITSQQDSLNNVARYISQAINRLGQ